MSAIRVLHVHTLPVVSGSGLGVLLMMRGQQAAGYDVEFACAPGGELLTMVGQTGIRVHPVCHLRQPISPWHDTMALLELWRMCRRGRYHIVHTHNSKAGVLGRLAAKLAGVPIIIHTVHGFAFHDREPWWRRRLFILLERWAARWCDQLTALSQPLVEWAVAERIAPREKMIKIYSGIEMAAFQQPVDTAAIRRELGWSDNVLIIGEVAKLWPGKGQEVLLQAFARLRTNVPRARLLFIGEGSEQPALERLTAELGLTAYVTFAGFQADAPRWTHVLDIAVLPSFFEGMGRTVVEAMACGKPVVGSRVGGIVELIEDGVTGLLVPPGDAAALAAALQRLLSDPALRARMGQAGQQRVTEQFDVQVMNTRMLAVYRQWLQRRGISA